MLLIIALILDYVFNFWCQKGTLKRESYENNRNDPVPKELLYKSWEKSVSDFLSARRRLAKLSKAGEESNGSPDQEDVQ